MSHPLIANLDSHLAAFSTKLRDDLGIAPPESNALASAMSTEFRTIEVTNLPTLVKDSPLGLKDRFEELISLINWLEQSKGIENQYGHIVAVNYICFVYLGDSLFTVLKKELPTDCLVRKCCNHLTENPVRAFRNALAHGNWRIILDRSGVDFWARKGSDPKEPLTRFRFSNDDLVFNQYLAIATAYAAMLAL